MATWSVMEVPNPIIVDAAGTAGSGYVLKSYLPGTTTSTSIAIDSSGGSPQASITANSEGKWEVSGNEILPYIDRTHKWGIFLNATDAAANTPFYMGPFNNVEQTLSPASALTSASLSVVFNTVADMIAGTAADGSTVSLSIGQRATTNNYSAAVNGGGAEYLAAATQAVDGYGDHTLANGNVVLLQSTGIVNVLQFGLKASVGFDNKAALQAAFDWLPNGGTLLLTVGVFGLSDITLISNDGVSFIGSGDESILQFDNSTDPYTVYGTRVGMVNVNANGCIVRDMQFDQNFRNSGRVDGQLARVGCLFLGAFYLSDLNPTSNNTVDNVYCYDVYGDAISSFIVSTNKAKFINNRITTTYIVQGWTTAGTLGEQCLNIGGGDDNIIDNNTILGALDDGIAIHNPNKRCRITNNTMTTTGGRIIITGGDQSVIDGNTIEYIQDGAYAIFVSIEDEAVLGLNQDISITNNTIKINTGVTITGGGIRSFAGGDRMRIQGNKLYTVDPQATGIDISEREFTLTTTFYNGLDQVVKDNVICNFNVGVKETATTTLPTGMIENNLIENCATNALNVISMKIGRNQYRDISGTIFTTNRSYYGRVTTNALLQKSYYIADTTSFSGFVRFEPFPNVSSFVIPRNVTFVGMTLENTRQALDQPLKISLFNDTTNLNEFEYTTSTGLVFEAFNFIPVEITGNSSDIFYMRAIDSAAANTSIVDFIVTLYYTERDV